MSKLAPALAVALLALPACASQGAAALPPAPAVAEAAGAAKAVGSLQIEPREIVYTRRRGKGVVLPVHVWQRGYYGEYTAKNHCDGVSVRLGKYTEHEGSFWNIAADHSGIETCVVVFTGTDGPRGKNSLHIKILR